MYGKYWVIMMSIKRWIVVAGVLMVCCFGLWQIAVADYNGYKFSHRAESEKIRILNQIDYIKGKTPKEKELHTKMLSLLEFSESNNLDDLLLTDQDMLYLGRESEEEHMADSAYWKGMAYVFDRDIPRDLDKASYWFIKSAEGGYWQGLYVYLGFYINGQIDRIGHAARVVELIKNKADMDDSKAQFFVGIMYLEGKELEQDTELGVKYLTASAEQGLVAAQLSLSAIFYGGSEDGVIEVDYDKSCKWLSLAAEQGDAEVEFYLGVMYCGVNGTKQNYPAAIKMFKRSADQGFFAAEYCLASMYYTGEGVAQNYIEAAKWYEKLAEEGDLECIVILGDMYLNGEGVEKNLDKAIEWYKRGAELGSEAAKDRLKELLPPETG